MRILVLISTVLIVGLSSFGQQGAQGAFTPASPPPVRPMPQPAPQNPAVPPSSGTLPATNQFGDPGALNTMPSMPTNMDTNQVPPTNPPPAMPSNNAPQADMTTPGT